MVRRSAPALLILFVCLLAAHLSSAAPALHLDESRVRLTLEERQALVRVEVSNNTGRELTARLGVELLDPRDKVRANAAADVRVRRGTNALEVPLELRYRDMLADERKQFPWYRLRYRLTPTEDGATPALEGVVSVSEAAPDLFELSVISAPATRPGAHYNARVRTANPVSGRPLKGVAVEAALSYEGEDDDKTVIKAAGTTGGDGFVTLDFELPRNAHAYDDEVELQVIARRGFFVEEVETDVTLDEKPSALLTTDKPLYQPGQTVHMRVLLFDKGERALADQELALKVDDEEGDAAFNVEVKTSRFGVASADWRLPDGAKLGTYTVKLEFDDDRYGSDYDVTRDFRVSRYDLPNFSVTAKPDRPYYLNGENPSVEVRADYLFGQPVKRGRVRVVRETERRWNYKEQKYETEEHPAVEGELSEGLYVARLDTKDEQKELAESGYERFRDLTFVAYVTDPTTDRTEQRRFQLRLTKEPIHLYVTEGRYRQARGLPVAFYLSASYADGTPAECDVTVYGEGETTTVVGADGRTHETREPDRALVNVRTNRYGVAKVVGPVLPREDTGRNVPLRFVARDRAGREGHHSEDFWLGFYGKAPEIRVETDKTVYAPGEPVKVELSSDAERMGVVVDAVSEGRVLYSRTVRLSGGRGGLTIFTGREFAGAVNINATSTAPASDEDEESYSVGARTVVFPRDRELKLDVKLSQKSYRPGEDADAQFAVRTADGRRAAGALGVVVFDKAVEERARTDGEAGRSFGFADSLSDYWYGYWYIGGVTRRDVERLDPTRPRPEGFDAVAELLYNSERPDDLYRVTRGTEFERNQATVYGDLINAQLQPLSAYLRGRYVNTAEYPSDEPALVRTLAQDGVDFKALRDPWGQPYSTWFSFERDKDRLAIFSSGADERPDTDDDFVAARFEWPYFRKTGEAINHAVAVYQARTGGYVRDYATLRAEAAALGLDLDALRDRWGQPYRFRFETSGTHHVITVESSGPDRVFAARREDASDDFDIWRLLTDYFEQTRKAVDKALDKNVREGQRFPRTREELAAALTKSSLSLDALRDGWGRPAYATFATAARYTDRIEVASRGAVGVRRSTKPVTQTILTLTLRSAGPDGREGTPDDFTLAYFSSVGAEQTAQDAAPVPVTPTTTFSGGTGAITGTVIDPAGAVVPGATVVARHNFTDFEADTTTNDAGVYLLRDLPSGDYTLTITSPGFRQFTLSSVRVVSANLTKVDAALTLGGVSEAVEVSAGLTAGNLIQQTTASVSQSVKKVALPQQPPLSTPRLREFFPETLVWSPELETARDGTAHLGFKLADNITTWKMSVIASTEDGRLGTAETEFLSFQPFFVEHDPPRVLTEGDEISLPVVLRNYLPRAQGVDVEMKPESWFALNGTSRQRADVPAGDAARPVFDFRAVASVTDGKQRVTALGREASDAIEKPVTVHPDGEERSATDGALLTDSGALSVNVPAEVVRGSLRGELKLYPNLSAHVLEGVEAIMSRPYGCGEQTISSTYPSVLVLNYHSKLKGGGSEPPIVERARKYARLGYERLLGYRAPGGGFTYWGHGDADLALTAYALRFLTDASGVIEVDENVIRETREWLLRQQRADGSWVAHTWDGHEDKSQTTLTTAFVTRVLAATQKFERGGNDPVAQTSTAQTAPAQASAKQEQETPLRRALRYTAARADESDEPYLIASLALAAADAGETGLVARAAARLRALALEEGTGTYWSLETNTPFYGWGLAGRVETTALAIQALNRHCEMSNADCGANNRLTERGLDFLLRKKDRYGVWYSTQATVNVFDAMLSAVAARAGAAGPQAEDVAEVFVNGQRAGQLTLPPPERLSGPLTLDLSNFIGAGANRVELRRRARATPAQAHLVTTFYVPWGTPAAAAPAEGGGEPKRPKASALKLSINYDRTQGEISQEVTCNVTAERVGHVGYGMMLAEVGLPPGADVDRASLERAVAESNWTLSSYDVLPDRLVVYLWPHSGGARFQFKFRPRYGLKALTAPSQLYDYYNPEARTVVAPTRFVVR